MATATSAADDILKELLRLEALSKPIASSSSAAPAKKIGGISGNTNIPIALEALEAAFEAAEAKLEHGGETAETTVDPELVLRDLQGATNRAKGEIENGIKVWYGALGRVRKAVDKSFTHQINEISTTYDRPAPLFSTQQSSAAMDQAIMNLMARRGCWDTVDALKGESSARTSEDTQRLQHEMQKISNDLLHEDVESALAWTTKHHAYLSSPPHPSALPFYLHRARYLSLLKQGHSRERIPSSGGPPAFRYAQDHLFPYLATHGAEVQRLLAAVLFDSERLAEGPYADLLSDDLKASRMVPLFQVEYCRLHGWPKEDPLDVVVELGANGALTKIERARKVMGDRLGDVRNWEELPMELPLPASRRYHSVFTCPVSKEQASETNPPMMLACGHAIAKESLTKLSKHGRREVKCYVCPELTATSSAQRLYF